MKAIWICLNSCGRCVLILSAISISWLAVKTAALPAGQDMEGMIRREQITSTAQLASSLTVAAVIPRISAVPLNCIFRTSHLTNLPVSKQCGVFLSEFRLMSGNRVWSPMCDSCAWGLWRIGISTRGNLGKDSHYPQFPPLPLSSSYTHDSRHCLDYIFSFQTLVVSSLPLYVFCSNSTCLILWLPSIALLGLRVVRWCPNFLSPSSQWAHCERYFPCFMLVFSNIV